MYLNEDLCLKLQEGNNRDRVIATLLQQNAALFKQWVMEAMATAINDTVKIESDELMAEALCGFRRAAEAYKPETEVSFLEYAETWVKARVRSYIRRAERGDLPDQMLASVKEYRRILNLAKQGVDSGSRTGIKLEELRNIRTAALFLVGNEFAGEELAWQQ